MSEVDLLSIRQAEFWEDKKQSHSNSKVAVTDRLQSPNEGQTTVAISTDQCTAMTESVQGVRKPL